MSRFTNKNLLSILFVIAVVLCGIKSTAQSTEFGVRATENYYVLDRTNVKTYSAYLGFSIMF